MARYYDEASVCTDCGIDSRLSMAHSGIFGYGPHCLGCGRDSAILYCEGSGVANENRTSLSACTYVALVKNLSYKIRRYLLPRLF